MAVTNEQNGLHGVYLVRSVGCYQDVYTPAELNKFLAPVGPIIPFDPVPTEWQYIKPWSPEDYSKLGVVDSSTVTTRTDEQHDAETPRRPSMKAIERMVT